jgi:transposase
MPAIPAPGAPEPAPWPVWLTDERWSQLWQLLAAHDAPPHPYASETDARDLILALLYVSLTGGDWSGLPASAPPAPRVRAAAAHWQQLGLLDRMSAVLGLELFHP